MAGLKVSILAGVLVVTAAFSTVSAALDVHCPPHIGDVEIDGNVLVAAPCELDGTKVKGEVRLFAGGSLLADGAEIRGNIKAQNSDFVILRDSVVDGNAELKGMVGDLSLIVLTEIDGNIKLEQNRSRLEIQDSRVDGNVEAERNTGGVLLLDNVIDGNLTCQRNHPSPLGSGNRVSGRRQGQCANLTFDFSAPIVGDDGGATEEPNTPSGDGGAVEGPSTPSDGLVLNPQPSGGGSAVGPLDAVLMGLLLLGRRLTRRRR
jgi:hypothetical protein